MGTSRGPTAGPGLRLARGGLLAAATLAVAVRAHSSADGNLPGTSGLVALWALSTAVAAGLLARPASVRRVVVLLCAGQGALHLLLSLVAGHGERTVPTPLRYDVTQSMLAESGPAAVTRSSAADLTAGLGSMLGDLTSGAGLLMTASHLVAAAVLGAWLAAGEKALWSALTGIAQAASMSLATLLSPLLATPVPAPGGPRAATFPEPLDGRGVDRLVGCPRRGPPAGISVAR